MKIDLNTFLKNNQTLKFANENLMKINVYTLLPNKVKDYIAEEISKTLAKNNIDNSAFCWDIDCNILDIEEDL